MADERDFLSRWSKRKLEDRETPEEQIAEAQASSADSNAVAPEAGAEDPDDHPAAGIDIDALDYNSDFTVFMHEKVPQAIRRRALRKLWLSDPILANVDGLNDYDEDFTDAALVVEGLKQSFDEARKRMLDREAAEKEAAEAAEPSAEEEPEGEKSPEDEALDEDPVPVAEGGEAEPEERYKGYEDPEDGDLEA